MKRGKVIRISRQGGKGGKDQGPGVARATEQDKQESGVYVS